MTLKTCLRCDWQGETKEPTCPNCGTRPLYVVGAPALKVEAAPVRNNPEERSRETPSAATTPPSETTPAPAIPSPSPGDAIEPTGRSPRSTIAYVVAVLVLIVVVGAWLNGQGASPEPAAATSVAPRSTPTGAGSSTQPPPLTPKTENIGEPTTARIGKQSLTMNGIPLSFSVPTSGWARWGDLYITKSTIGPQDADAIILWTDVWRGNHARACGQWWGSPGGSVTEWARQASRTRGAELVTGPAGVMIGGYPAQHVVLTVRKDVACNPGFFHHWDAPIVGPFWSSVDVGDTVRIWLVDVGGKVLYIEGDTHNYAGAHLKKEVDKIVASTVFD